MAFDIHDEVIVAEFAPGRAALNEGEVHIVLGEFGEDLKECASMVDIDIGNE